MQIERFHTGKFAAESRVIPETPCVGSKTKSDTPSIDRRLMTYAAHSDEVP